MVIFSISCNNTENNSNQSKDNEVKKEDTKTETSLPDISGKYKMPENTCSFELIISKEKGEYSYNFKGKNGILDIFGKLSVSNDNGTTYVNFTLPESFSVKTVEGLLENNTITIQNYGNADNQFTIFEDCEDKYMEFIKN
jgi:hypothetical protein